MDGELLGDRLDRGHRAAGDHVDAALFHFHAELLAQIVVETAQNIVAAIDEALCEEGIKGGPVAWLHDEIVLEVPIEEAKRAAELLEEAMVEAFAKTFPNAPLNDLVDVHNGTTWASLKT